MEYVKLNDGLEIPAIGFGTFLIPADGTTYETVKNAIDLGIRHIDTAVAYFNEQEVGRAVKDSEVEREDIWITSKLWLQDYEYEDAKKLCTEMSDNLQRVYTPVNTENILLMMERTRRHIVSQLQD